VIEVGLGAFDLFENVIGLCGPDNGFGLTVVFFDISEDACWESFDAGTDATSELILGQVAEESFDHVEPTAAARREVKMKAPVARHPALNRRVLVAGTVVDDKVKLFVGGRLAIDEKQEL